MSTRQHIVEGWFGGSSDKAYLIGSKCKTCGEIFFPKAESCRNSYCGSTTFEMEDVHLSRTGLLWSYTVNYYPPPVNYMVDPKNFKPYVVAAVELADEQMKVIGRVPEIYDPEQLKIGMEMELVLGPLYKNQDGDDVVTWMWKPIEI